MKKPQRARTKDYGNTARTFKMPGRNALCSCGSGKKYKKCCLEKNGSLTSYSHNELKRMEAIMKQQEQIMKEEKQNDNTSEIQKI